MKKRITILIIHFQDEFNFVVKYLSSMGRILKDRAYVIHIDRGVRREI